jgi:ribosomal protein S18 acetylase RimI-like enzyme
VPLEYFKRLHLARDLASDWPATPAYRWQPWHPSAVDRFAELLHRCFADEVDADLFPTLGSPTGCRMLVRAIQDCDVFCPSATGLVLGPAGAAGVVFGSLDRGIGTIPNLGVVPEARGRGLGAALLARSLAGFAGAGARRVELEVTAANVAAVALYRRFGFRAYKSSYRTREVPDRTMVGLGI